MKTINNHLNVPAFGFGTLIPDAAVIVSATRDAPKVGFRHFDFAERYWNESEVGEALQVGLAAAGLDSITFSTLSQPGFFQ